MTALKFVTKSGGTSSPILQNLAVKIQDICNQYNLKVEYHHIPGVNNIQADQLSRQRMESPLYEAMIPNHIFNKINKKWGPLTIDAFASRQNRQLHQFWSLRPDPEATALDAFNQRWTTRGMYLFPPWKFIPQTIIQLKRQKIRDAALITPCPANNVQDRQMENGRMAIIRSKRQRQGMTEDEIEFLEYNIRKNTRKVYNNGWKKWENWCKQQLPTVNPQAYDPDNVLKFLMNHRNYSSQHLNGLRSSIASVFRVLHPNETPLAQQEKIVQFFQAKRHQEIKTPTEADLSTWDTDIVVHYAKTNWRNNHQLTLFDLQKKTLIILCLATMARPRSDIGRLMYKNVQFTLQDNKPVSVLLLFPEAKETNMKTARFGLIDEVEVCLTRTLFHFIQRTQSLRQNLPDDHTLFLTYLDNKNKTSSSVRPSTVSSWVKQIMTEAGIDTTVYKAHSIRSASSTKAIELGISQDKVEEHEIFADDKVRKKKGNSA
ncbi:hypothetical protein G6F38_012729 [Rhizopus arrhizus]|nr:hypothetical protein G6F38_012729 [Rhizopus arrhizus]